jgi:gamma-glutamyltranspeptidase / glutathione hydrolase
MRKWFIAALVLVLAPAGFASQDVPTDLGVSSRTGLVVAASDIAADLGAGVLAKGGNAVDAAVATAFAMAVTYPFAGNLGGGGFMVIRTADGKATTIDYRETAPAAATPDMYLDQNGNIVRSRIAVGYLGPGVPGTVRGLALAHEKYGHLPWKAVVMPAADLAASGFVMSASLASGLNRELAGPMRAFPASVAAYGKPGGGTWTEGDRLVLPDLSKSLTAIANEGPDVFYRGWIADHIAADMAANGGIMTKADLEAYRAKERAPITGTFEGYDVISMPPPSSGGITLVEMLNMLEALDIQKKARGSVDAIHLMTEVMRRAYLDRARYLGDTDFVHVPSAMLLSKAHARDLIRTIDPKKATSSVELGKDIVTQPQVPEPADTTHFSVVDKDGMAVSNTYTLEGGYGSHVVVSGAGFLLNNEMGDFNRKPGTTDLTGNIGTPPNLIAPGKRMLSSMTPTIVTKNGKLVLVTGSPGSRTIINTVLDVVLDVTAWGLTGREAVDAPRMHHQWLPDVLTIEGNGVSAQTLAGLQALGHTVRMAGTQGSAQSIWFHPITGTAFGVADRRDRTAKASKPN